MNTQAGRFARPQWREHQIHIRQLAGWAMEARIHFPPLFLWLIQSAGENISRKGLSKRGGRIIYQGGGAAILLKTNWPFTGAPLPISITLAWDK